MAPALVRYLPIRATYRTERGARRMLARLHGIAAAEWTTEHPALRRLFDLIAVEEIRRTKKGRWRVEVVAFLVEREAHGIPTGHA